MSVAYNTQIIPKPTSDIPQEIPVNRTWAYHGLFEDTWRSLSGLEQKILLSISLFDPGSTLTLNAVASSLGLSRDDVSLACDGLVAAKLLSKQIDNVRGSVFAVTNLIYVLVTWKWSDHEILIAEAKQLIINYYAKFVAIYGDDDVGQEVGRGKEGNKAQLESEARNLLCVIKWCLEEKRTEALTLVEHVTTFLLDTGAWDLRIDLCNKAYVIASEQKIVYSQIGLLQRLGWSYFVRGDDEQSEHCLRYAMTLVHGYAHAEDHPGRYPQLLRDLGLLLSRKGNFSEGLELLHQSHQVATSRKSHVTNAEHLNSLSTSVMVAKVFRAWALVWQGKATGKREPYREAEIELLGVLDEALSEKRFRQLTLIYRLLASIAIQFDRLKEAEHYLTEAPKYVSDYYKAYVQAEHTCTWGDWYFAAGKYQLAVDRYRTAYYLAALWGMRHETQELRAAITHIVRQHRKHLDAMYILWYNKEIKNNIIMVEQFRSHPVQEELLFDERSNSKAHRAILSKLSMDVALVPEDERIGVLTEIVRAIFASSFGDRIRAQLQTGQLGNSETQAPDFEDISHTLHELIETQRARSNRPPTRLEALAKAFAWGRKEIVLLEEVAREFNTTKSAQNSLSNLAQMLESCGLELEHIPAYRLRRRAPSSDQS